MSRVNGTFDDDYLTGSLNNDNIYGSLGNDILVGGNGDDTLNGGRGSDSLYGGNGDDTLVSSNFAGSKGSDLLFGGPGKDTFRLTFDDGFSKDNLIRVIDYSAEDTISILDRYPRNLYTFNIGTEDSKYSAIIDGDTNLTVAIITGSEYFHLGNSK